MSLLVLFLMVLGAVLFFLVATGVTSAKYNLLAAGLFCWILAEILTKGYGLTR